MTEKVEENANVKAIASLRLPFLKNSLLEIMQAILASVLFRQTMKWQRSLMVTSA